MIKRIKPLTYGDFSTYRTELMGIAAIMVVATHLVKFVVPLHFPGDALLYSLNVGVEIFFFLSGVGLYFAFSKRKVNYASYMKKRALNVYVPSLYISLPFFLCQDFIFTHNGLLSFLLDEFGISYWYTDSNINWYVYWSMLFYAAYPLLFRLLQRQKEKKYGALPAVLALCAIAAVVYVLLMHTAPHVFQLVEIGLARVPVFLVGCYFGILVYEKRPMTWKYLVLSLFGFMIWAAVKYDGFSFVERFVPQYHTVVMVYRTLMHGLSQAASRYSHCLLMFSLLLLLVYIFKHNIMWLNRMMRFVGSMSLEVYLVHIMLSRICIGFLHVEYLALWQYALVVVAAFFISYPLSKLRGVIVKHYVKHAADK